MTRREHEAAVIACADAGEGCVVLAFSEIAGMGAAFEDMHEHAGWMRPCDVHATTQVLARPTEVSA